MAITITETFSVQAPIEEVWAFLMDPQRVVACMPGAQLDEVMDERTFLGNMKVKVGPVVATYRGKVQFTEIDDAAHVIQMTAEGTETSGGSARGTMSSRLLRLEGGGTEVVAEAKAEVTGRVAQFGRGMIQGVSQQLFRQFSAAVTERLESATVGADDGVAEARPVSVLPLVLKQLWNAIAGAVRRLFRRQPKA